MQINSKIIRGYDIRGVANEDLSTEIAEHFGKAYGTYIQQFNVTKIVAGYDSRATSVEYKDAFVKGVASTGLDVIDIGLTLVGTIYWAQYHFNTRGAAMITASHNPAEYNGFKLAKDFSDSMIADDLKDLEKIINTEKYIKSTIPGKIEQQNIQEIYFNNLLKRNWLCKPTYTFQPIGTFKVYQSISNLPFLCKHFLLDIFFCVSTLENKFFSKVCFPFRSI